jgi:hypothetical protein
MSEVASRDACCRLSALPLCFWSAAWTSPVIGMNEQAFNALRSEKQLVIVEGAGHLFEEPGTLDEVVRHATKWFLDHLHTSAERS